ncbi:hypothetical protein SKAU_G00089500 [Synaphobranchus kaupii]|uniref:Uncharacterized protein n=1 Tax=Synaphobranchus kaupii TaxID=118154 RepID=A0A9Q1FWJ5_SYNKA|nr:hypothetical protein SKAU_G00089500 [Synaphobranchus kaupii]
MLPVSRRNFSTRRTQEPTFPTGLCVHHCRTTDGAGVQGPPEPQPQKTQRLRCTPPEEAGPTGTRSLARSGGAGADEDNARENKGGGGSPRPDTRQARPKHGGMASNSIFDSFSSYPSGLLRVSHAVF